MPNAKLQSYLHFHVIVFIWGFTAVLGALISIDALPLVFYRMWLASGFIFLWILYKKKPLKMTAKQLLILASAGIVIALHWLTFFEAIKVSNVSITLALIATGAFFTSIMEPIFYKRKVIWYEVFFGVLVIAGLYIIFNVETDYVLGIILALISAFLSAVFSLINGKLAQKGTGNARHASRKAPIFVGGGVAHGPKGQLAYKTRKLNKSEKRNSIASLISEKNLNKNLLIFNDFSNEIKKTKEMFTIIKKFELSNSLIILDKSSKEKIGRSARNIPNLKVTDVNHFSAFDIVKFKKIVFTESSVKELEKRYS